jgi:hypothetical protein
MVWLSVIAAVRAETVLVAEVPLANGTTNPSYVTVTERAGITQPFLYMRHPHPSASVILFTGGDGRFLLSPSGFGITPTNFLGRTRDHFYAHGFSVALVDVPSDRLTLSNFRTTPEHAQDIEGVIDFLRQRSHAPVWLVGTSFGTVSVASIASLLTGHEGPDGIVLTSSLTRPSPPPDVTTVFTANLAAIRIPVLVIHHKFDNLAQGCAETPVEDMPLVMGAMVNARRPKLMIFDGGGPPSGNVCQTWAFHGFPGIEAPVIDAIADYIRNDSRRGDRDGDDRH